MSGRKRLFYNEGAAQVRRYANDTEENFVLTGVWVILAILFVVALGALYMVRRRRV